jgi:hypothetical protein
VSVNEAMQVAGPAGPGVRLLDARSAGLDHAGLRSWAREESAATGAPHVSRSYRYPYCMMAWHTEPVGVDIERIGPVDAGFVASISAPAERRAPAPAGEDDEYATALWCSKEALAKALGDALRYDPRRLESPLGWPDGRAGPWRALEVAAPPRHTAWACWRATVDAPVAV